MEILTHFSGLAITYESDRVTALAGLVAYLSKATGEECFAGIWSYRFHEGLLWFVTRERIQREINQAKNDTPLQSLSQCPSWSWTSTTDIVGYPNFPHLFRSCLDDWEIERPLGWRDSPNNPRFHRVKLTGFITDAEVGMEDPRRTAIHQIYCQLYSTDRNGNGRPNLWRTLDDARGKTVGSAILDRPGDLLTRVQCLLVAIPERSEDQQGTLPYMSNFALLLTATGEENEYHRVGLAGVDLHWMQGGRKRSIYIC